MDQSFLFFWIFNLSNQNSFLDKFMVFGADYVIYLTLAFLFIIAIRGGANERKSLIVFSLSLPILILIIKIIHLFILEQRPFVIEKIVPLINLYPDASFPSRHTAIMASIAFSYALFKSRWHLPLTFLAAWVGFARVYVGVHYPFDILGGFIVGFISALISRKTITLLKTKLF